MTRTFTTPLTWGGLTLPQRERLLGISRGQHAQRGDETWMSLLNNKLIEVVYTYPADVAIDALTPLGGDLLRQRDEVLIDFIQAVLADEMGSGDGDKVAGMNALADKWGLPDEHRGDCYQDLIIAMAQAALAQVQEGGEHE